MFGTCLGFRWLAAEPLYEVSHRRNQVEVERTDYYGNSYKMTMFANQLVKDVSND
jgi:hypothetical protein